MSISSGASKPSSGNSNQPGGFFSWFESRIVPPLHRFGDLPAVASVREALPWSLIGLASALVVLFFTVPHDGSSLPAQYATRMAGALLPSLAVMAAALVVILPVRLARTCGFELVPYLLACVAAFAFALPQPFDSHLLDYAKTVGATGLFLAIVVSLLVAGAFSLARRFCAPRIADWLACVVTLLVFGALFATHVSLANLLHVGLQPLTYLGDTYVALIAIVFVEMLFWTAGVHGPALLAAIVTPLYLTMQTQNGEAFAHHLPLPHIVVVSLFLFVFPGGSGATLPLAVLLSISRVPRLRAVGRLTIVPSFFNVNEPLLFGLPIVFNPFLALPFILAPMILATTTYAAVAWGWVGRPVYYVPSTIPTFVSTFLATLDWRALVLVAVNIAIAGACYWPFVRAYERHEAAA
jgi:PTS system cellobiose-specific IIC component